MTAGLVDDDGDDDDIDDAQQPLTYFLFVVFLFYYHRNDSDVHPTGKYQMAGRRTTKEIDDDQDQPDDGWRCCYFLLRHFSAFTDWMAATEPNRILAVTLTFCKKTLIMNIVHNK